MDGWMDTIMMSSACPTTRFPAVISITHRSVGDRCLANAGVHLVHIDPKVGGSSGAEY